MRVLSAHPWLAGGFLVVAALVAAAIVWWLIPNEPLSAQEVMADACIDAAITLDYDVTVRIMAPEDTGEWTTVEVSGNGLHARFYTNASSSRGTRSGGGTLVHESYMIWGTDSSSSSDASTRSEESSPAPIANYNRRLEDGQWTDWRVSETPFEGSSDIARFCGFPLDDFTTFEYNGEETVNGVLTKKFTGMIDVEQDVFDTRFEFWVDSSGKLLRQRRKTLSTDHHRDATFSGFGEANVITAPRIAGDPSPEPTPEPTLAPTLEPSEHPGTHDCLKHNRRLAGTGPGERDVRQRAVA